jgi:hypothetical protein
LGGALFDLLALLLRLRPRLLVQSLLALLEPLQTIFASFEPVR